MTHATQMVIKYPNGASQVVKPNPQFFKGNWYELAQSIGAPFFPSNQKVAYELK